MALLFGKCSFYKELSKRTTLNSNGIYLLYCIVNKNIYILKFKLSVNN